MTWVETGSGVRPSFAATWASTRGSTLAKVPTAPEIGAGRDLRARRDEAGAVAREARRSAPASFRPKVVGSAWMPWLRPMIGGRLVLVGAALERGEQRVEIGEQDVARPRELHREAGVEHVRRGHALMQEARLRPDDLPRDGSGRR